MFWVGVAVLLALAAVFSLGPFLWKGRRSAQALAREEENVRIYRERLAEIQRERAEDRLSGEDARELEAEIKRSLLRDTEHAEAGPRVAGSGYWLGFVVVALVATGSVLLYMARGDIDGLTLAEAFQQLEERPAADPARELEAKALTQRLLSRVHEQPNNPEMWYLLGRTGLSAGEYRLSAGAFRQVLQLGSDDLAVRIYLVQALYLASGRQVTPEVRSEIDTVLSRRENEPIMVEILAADAFRRKDYAAAARWLERGLGQRLAPEREAYFEQALTLARANLGVEEPLPEQPGFEVQVDVAPQLRDNLPPSTLVFILARAPGERMPLAVARRQIGELPVTVVLDDSSAMNPARRLSTADAVEIVARTAIGGSVSRSADDVEAVAGPFRLKSGITPVRLLLQGESAL